MGEGISDQLIRQVVASTIHTCGACAQPLDEWAVAIIGHQEDLWFFSVTCRQCETRLLAAALVRDSQSIALADYSAREHESTGRQLEVDAEDVRDINRFLETFDGDFRALFG